MDIKELSLGNYVSTSSGEAKVVGINIDSVKVLLLDDDTETIVSEDNLKPIPVSAEFLVLNDFSEERNLGYVYSNWEDTVVIYSTFSERLRIIHNYQVTYDSMDWAPLPVHKFQNILKMCEVDIKIKL